MTTAGDRSLLDSLRWLRLGVERPSPLYFRLLGDVIDDVEAGGVCRRILQERGNPGPDLASDAYGLRFLGGLHRLVLSGAAPDLARWYPSAGGTLPPEDGDLRAALLAAAAQHEDALVAALDQPVQTNEVGRCGALLLGFQEAAGATGLPLRVLEIGASAGLNLRWDHFRYEGGLAGSAFGDPASPLRFDDIYREPLAHLDRPAEVVERRGCDLRPVDVLDPQGLLLLRSFVWPDQLDRLQRLDAAVAVARRVPAAVDQADAGRWLGDQLATRAGGLATVVYHSIVWQYLPPDTRAAVTDRIEEAGAAATRRAPVGWLRFEPAEDPAQGTETRLRLWPGGDERLLARCGYHGKPVRAAGPARGGAG